MKKLISILLVVVMIATCLIGCGESEDREANRERFQFVENAKMGPNVVSIYVDTETGVLYLHGHESITVLLDSDGTALLWEGVK